MAFKVTISSDGDSIALKLGKLKKELGEAQSLKEMVAASLVTLTERTFSAQADPWGHKWKPSQRAIIQHGLTLVDTGLMRASFIAADEGGEVYFGQKMGAPKKSSYYTRRKDVNPVNYFNVHQYGTKKLPRRAMAPIVGSTGAPRLALPDSYKTFIEKAIEREVNDILSRR
jgi:phage gpG-like protein